MDCLTSDRFLIDEGSVSFAKKFFSKYSKKYRVHVLKANWDFNVEGFTCVKFICDEKALLLKFLKKFKKAKVLFSCPDFINVGIFVDKFCNIEGEPF